jgi:hypothetical protein
VSYLKKQLELCETSLAISAQSVLAQEEHEQQAPPASQGQASSSASVQSVTGCVVKIDQGHSPKTESDTYPIETSKDLSKYVDKRVRVTGILEHHNTTPSEASGKAVVLTDIRLRTVVAVVGIASNR